jgi:RNA polymerase sigma factor (sigma-70 family)
MATRPPSDAELLASAADPASFEQFYRRHLQTVVRFGTRRCRSADEVAELASMVFLEAMTSAHGYDGRRGPARAWLLGIASHCLADLHGEQRRAAEMRRRLGGAAVFTPDEGAEVEARIDAERLYPAARRALARLPAAERDLLLLVEREGISGADAARALGISAVAGRVRLSRARRRLQQELDRRPAPLSHPEEARR